MANSVQVRQNVPGQATIVIVPTEKNGRTSTDWGALFDFRGVDVDLDFEVVSHPHRTPAGKTPLLVRTVTIMNQIVQSPRQGTIEVLEVPPPQLRGPGALVHTAASLISAGTERAALEFAKGSLLDKARSRPDLVKQVMSKVRRDGIVQAFEVAMSRLDRPMAPGYACAGTIIEVSPDVPDLMIGDRVACAGAGYATHAEVNYVPKNLIVPIPKRHDGDFIGFDEATFATLGAIALHGARLAQPQLGDHAVVIGLGAIGLLAVQVLRAHGCRVGAVDLDTARCDLACALGADFAATSAEAPSVWPHGLAIWAPTWCSSLRPARAAALPRSPPRFRATRDGSSPWAPSDSIFHVARSTRRNSRSSCRAATAPDATTVNMRSRARLSAAVCPLDRAGKHAGIPRARCQRPGKRARRSSHTGSRLPKRRTLRALERESVLGILLTYPDQEAQAARGTRVDLRGCRPRRQTTRRRMPPSASLVPVILHEQCCCRHSNANRAFRLRGIVTASGLSARSAAEKFDFAYCSTNASDLWKDDDCNAVVIATRHDAHARLVIEGLEAGKAMFVEKPLCLTETELEEIEATNARLHLDGRQPFVMVGFNRRFSPAVGLIKAHFKKIHSPVSIVYRVNAGRVPHGSWVTSSEGGGAASSAKSATSWISAALLRTLRSCR